MWGSGGEPDPFAIEKIEHGAIILYNESFPARLKERSLQIDEVGFETNILYRHCPVAQLPWPETS